jgi:hypothetical protein
MCVCVVCVCGVCVCVDKMKDFLNPKQTVYSVTVVFLKVYDVVAFRLKGTNKTQNYILLNIKVVTLVTTKN